MLLADGPSSRSSEGEVVNVCVAVSTQSRRAELPKCNLLAPGRTGPTLASAFHPIADPRYRLWNFAGVEKGSLASTTNITS